MAASILIVGQGLAGTLLAWELHRAGIDFAVADAGPAGAATLAAAGIINPITGRRLVPSWRYETLRPLAGATYRALGAELGLPLWREMRVRRLFADAREREVFARKRERGELGPAVTGADDDGFWITDAARVDLVALLPAARAWLRGLGRLREERVAVAASSSQHELIIDTTGRAAAESGAFAFVPWEFLKGDVLEVAVDGLAPDVILNRRHWIVPVAAGAAWAGATHEPGVRDPRTSETAGVRLARSVGEMLAGRTFAVTRQRAGVRVNVPDKRPVAGRHPQRERLGLTNALGSKGALWAPYLARQWVDHLATGAPFDPEVDVRRFAAGGSADGAGSE